MVRYKSVKKGAANTQRKSKAKGRKKPLRKKESGKVGEKTHVEPKKNEKR